MMRLWGTRTKVGPRPVMYAPGAATFRAAVAGLSDNTQELIHNEVRRIVDAAHEEVVVLLKDNRDKLDSLAAALLEHETLDEDEAYAAAHVEKRTEGTGVELAAAA